MNHLFVPYDIAKKLKQNGFQEPCFGDYFKFQDNDKPFLVYDEDRFKIIPDNPNELITETPAPIYQQVIDWFQSKHNIYIQSEAWNNSFIPTIKKPVKGKVFLATHFIGLSQDTNYKALDITINEAFNHIK